ncbi:MAG: alkaline phosphatase D family protein [Dehalococcoidia bacterium]
MPAVFPDPDLDHAAELGAIDSRSIRVWVRESGRHVLTAQLKVDGEPMVSASVQLSAETDWTGVLTLTLPHEVPGAAFECQVGEHRLSGRLAPANADHGRLVFGFGSCNRPFDLSADGSIVVSPRAALYPAMSADLRRHGADFVLLAGDQVYSDELAPVSVRENLPGDAQHPPPLDEVVAAYRRVSRGFLGESGFRGLRQAFPTYCIWDDHDVFNCWGSRLEKTPLDQRMFEAASRAYCEYQHTRNPGGAVGPPPYNYTFRRGDIGFLVLDIRGRRDYEQHQLLGMDQWQAIQTYLAGDDAATVQTLFVVSSIPVAHVSRWMAKLFDRMPGNNGNAVRDRWCSAAFIDSRDALLGELFAWQARFGYRQVIFLSGDVHCASAFTIRRREGKGRIEQFTSSAMTTPDPITQRSVNWLAVLQPNLFEPKLRFKRHLLTFLNNYGLVTAEPLPSGGHRVSFTVRAWRPRQGRLGTVGQVTSVPGDC